MSEDPAKVMRQAIAGMLWSKQFFFFDGDNWLDEHTPIRSIPDIEIPETRSGFTC